MPPSVGGVAIKGAAISNGNNDPCSLAVASVSSDDKGWPTKISTPYPLKYITNDYPLNISFTTLPPSETCTSTPSWIVTSERGFYGDPVMVGNPDEFPVPRFGYFYIKKYDSTKFYKFAFCYSTASCGYVTLTLDSQNNDRLIVTPDRSVQPLAFKFVKATSSGADDDVTSGITMVV